jgi:hypothetical protein
VIVNFSGRHRLTPKTRAVHLWTQVRELDIPEVVIVLFWGVWVAVGGFVAGFVWAQVAS